MRKDLIWGS